MAVETAGIDRAFLARIGALWEPDEFDALLDRDLVERLSRARPGLYGAEDAAASELAAAAARTIDRRAFMSPASSTGSDLVFELELDEVLESLASLSFS